MIELIIIVAVSRNEVIGAHNQLPWTLKDDLQRFKTLSLGLPLIIGRKNHQAIGRILPGRPNLVITSKPNSNLIPGAQGFLSIEDAILWCENEGFNQAVIAGGGEIYRQAIALSHRLIITEIDAEIPGDIFFRWNKSEWLEIAQKSYIADDRNQYPVCLRELIRVNYKSPRSMLLERGLI